MKFRKKPIIIDAVKWRGDNWPEVCGFLQEGNIRKYAVNPSDESISITTLEGVMKASLFDWIIRGIKGELYTCKPEIFEVTYEVVEGEKHVD